MTTEERMISMVDFNTFLEAVKVTIGSTECTINQELVMDYLRNWAKAKKDIFTAFGDKLSIELETEVAADESVVEAKVSEVKKEFPQYAAILDYFDASEYKRNSVSAMCNTSRRKCFFQNFPDMLKNGKKVTKIISELCNDPKLDVALSNVLQGKGAKGVVSVSIHPLDFVTLSTSGHGWKSCMEITGYNGGFNKVGGFSLMQDTATMVCQFYGSDYTISNGGGSFVWHNKVYRRLAFLSPHKECVYMGHYIGTPDDSLVDMWQKMISDVIFPGEKVDRVNRGFYMECAGHFYYDSCCYFAFGKDFGEKTTMGVKELTCVSCGKKFNTLINYKGFLVHKSEVKGGDVR